MADRVLLDTVLLRCTEDRYAASKDPECANARKAIDRLAVLEAEQKKAQREAEFERARNARRQRDQRRSEQQMRRELLDEEAERRRSLGYSEWGAYRPESDSLEAPPDGLSWTTTPPGVQYTGPTEEPTPGVGGGAARATTIEPAPSPEPADQPGAADGGTPPVMFESSESASSVNVTSSQDELRNEIRRLEEELERRREANSPEDLPLPEELPIEQELERPDDGGPPKNPLSPAD